MSFSAPPSVLRPSAPRLILASTSRTRRDLLAGVGLSVEAIPPGIDERALEAECVGLAPRELAERLAGAKAQAVAAAQPDAIVIGADQVLALDGEVFHKPADAEAARNHIARLQGRTHELHSAVAIVRQGRTHLFCESASLTMRPLDRAAIAAYTVLAGEDRVTASVGAYQLEGLGLHLFERVEGDHATILGLPLLPLLARLRAWNLLAF